ncbi:MAG: FAD-binding and (Fe-S)-binding domain-containing protein [Planctomycetota bacterium]|jgi:Fe-S oxidoreductase/FAD/FMN-containing dehydrogenase
MKTKTLRPDLRDALVDQFGDRVTWDPLDRLCYSHDIGVMPKFVKVIVGDTTPAAVVQPVSEAEILTLVRLASHYGVPLVPRGKSTSGYGGVIPTRGGIVVDFWRMRRILEVDSESGVVKVEPGVIWKGLERRLNAVGLAARTYPSSAPSSTVAGWLAQGGTGFGAMEYGWFRESVKAARVVHFDGTVQEYAGEDLDLISDAEGITGFITRVDLYTRPLSPEIVLGATFQNGEDLAGAVKALGTGGIPAWSLSFTNPEMGRLKNAMPARVVHGEPVEEERETVPEAYSLICVFPEDRARAVVDAFSETVEAHGGALLSKEEAHHEWEDRFNIMMVKRLGPSLIPAESVVPLDGLGDFLHSVEEKIQHLLVKEGVVVKGPEGNPEIAILGFIPHDERRFGFAPAFALSLTFVKAAKAVGGRAYSTGLYFKGERNAVLGAERVSRMEALKARTDPDNLLNPDKVLGPLGTLGRLMSAASVAEPLGRAIGNLFRRDPGERVGTGKRIPAQVEEHAYACAQCGYCVDGCDEFYGRGWESHAPRGKWFLLRKVAEGKIPMSQDLVDRILVCTTCEMCNRRCPVELPIEPDWLTLRGYLVEGRGFGTFPPFEMMAASLGAEGNIWAGDRKNRSDWIDEEVRSGLREDSDTYYFAGCTASYVEQDIAKGTTKLLKESGVEFNVIGNRENCCGIPMLVAGKWEDWERNLRKNVENFRRAGAKNLITSCPACWLVWHTFYPQWCERLGIPFPFKTRHYSEVLEEKLREGKLTFEKTIPKKLTWHDSCHMGRAGKIYEEPRALIQAVPGVEFCEMQHNREEGLCCGSVLTLIRDYDVAAEIGKTRLMEAKDIEAEAVLASCPCCEFQLRVAAEKTGTDIEVKDLAAFLAEAKGIEMPDPHRNVLASWAVFEAMIDLMTPKGFAAVMEELFPQLASAMPAPMRGMVWVMRWVPEPLRRLAFAPMKPMLPLLFPLLAPRMMAQVMDDMLKIMARKVPMPDAMREMMPDLMPKVMENLMPHMLPHVASIVAGPMVDYLRTRKPKHEPGEGDEPPVAEGRPESKTELRTPVGAP